LKTEEKLVVFTEVNLKAISREQAHLAVNDILSSERSVSAIIIMSDDGAMLADGRSMRTEGDDNLLLEVPELMSFPLFGVHVFLRRRLYCDRRSLYNRTSKALRAASRPKE